MRDHDKDEPMLIFRAFPQPALSLPEVVALSAISFLHDLLLTCKVTHSKSM